jgi:prevent-host-death family protein
MQKLANHGCMLTSWRFSLPQEAAMQVTATELQNNFGKYLRLSALEPVVITRNGIPEAVLSAASVAREDPMVRETMPEYGTNPKKRRLTGYREFIELTEHSDNRYELIDGIVYQLASPGIFPPKDPRYSVCRVPSIFSRQNFMCSVHGSL